MHSKSLIKYSDNGREYLRPLSRTMYIIFNKYFTLSLNPNKCCHLPIYFRTKSKANYLTQNDTSVEEQPFRVLYSNAALKKLRHLHEQILTLKEGTS